MKRIDACLKKEKIVRMSILFIPLTQTFLGYPHFPLFILPELVTPSIFSIFFFSFSSVPNKKLDENKNEGEQKREKEDRLYDNIYDVSLK